MLAVGTLLGCRPGAEGTARGGQGGSEGEDKGQNPVTRERVFLTRVLTEEAQRGELRSVISTTGSVIPLRTAAVRTEEPGRVLFSRDWREGDEIEAGTVIARIESEGLDRELELNLADVEIQRETLNLGEKTMAARLREYRTLQELYAQGVVAKRDVDSLKLQLDQAVNSQRQNEINLAKAEARVAEVKRRRERLVLTAPYDGLLVSRSTLEGQGRFNRGFGNEAITDHEGRQVASGQVICGVVDTSRVFLRCDVTSKDLGSIGIDQLAEITVYAREDIVREGRVARISRSVNPETRAFEVDIEVENPDGALKPGMFGKSDVVVERRFDTIAVDKSVVTRRNNQDVVFTVVEQPDTDYEVARMVPVTLGLEGKGRIEILSGLRSGDRVIMRNFEVLQDNAAVRAVDVDAPLVPDAPEDAATVDMELGGGEDEDEGTGAGA